MTNLPEIRGRYDITPWDVMLDEVQRASFRADWVDRVCQVITDEMQEAEADMHSDTDDANFAAIKYKSLRAELKEWLKESREERKHLVSVSNDCIKHDIQKYLIMKTEMNGRLLAKVLGDAMDQAKLEPEARRRVVMGLRDALENVSGDLSSGQNRGLETVTDIFGKVQVKVVDNPQIEG